MRRERASRSQRGRTSRSAWQNKNQGEGGISQENLQKAAGALLHPPFSYTVAS